MIDVSDEGVLADAVVVLVRAIYFVGNARGQLAFVPLDFCAPKLIPGVRCEFNSPVVLQPHPRLLTLIKAWAGVVEIHELPYCVGRVDERFLPPAQYHCQMLNHGIQ